MNEPTTTMIGNVAQDVRHAKTEQGVPITTFRLASTRRHFDRALGRWVDGETIFVSVTCWRALADHVYASISKGDPIVVTGRIRVRAWEREGYKGNAIEIDAYTVGHDLNRGTSAFRRSQPRAAVSTAEREVADDLLVTMERSRDENVVPVPAEVGSGTAAASRLPDAETSETTSDNSSGVSETRRRDAA